MKNLLRFIIVVTIVTTLVGCSGEPVDPKDQCLADLLESGGTFSFAEEDWGSLPLSCQTYFSQKKAENVQATADAIAEDFDKSVASTQKAAEAKTPTASP